MRSAAGRSVSALLVSLCALVFASLMATPGATAASRSPQQTQQARLAGDPAQNGAPCQNHDRPPPPIDTSEEPKPGVQSPQALPVPEEPVGGTRMGECGIVQPADQDPPPGDVASASWVIADLDSGAVLAAKDPHARERPASLIKALLAIVVVRELRQETVVAGTQEDADQEGTKVGLGPGGQYTVKQLLQVLVMKSGNDAANALARQLGGVPAALEKMNALAKELGALDTRAATPSGLDGPGMSTSAYDLSVIFRAAMKHKEFAEAVGTKQVDFPGYGGKPGFKVSNDNRLLGSYEGFLGGKTGFTDDARHTYLGGAKRDGRRLSVVMMRGERNPDPLADQGAKLLDYGFALAKASAKPVGQLVDRAPEAQPKQGDTGLAGGPGNEPAPQDGQHAVADAQRSAFGSFGMPLVVLAGVAILIAGLMVVRRNRAKAARAARLAASSAQI